jgi:hypothetical protein
MPRRRILRAAPIGMGLGLGFSDNPAASGSVFSPSSLSSLVMWLRADQGFSSGTWTDQSSTGLVFSPGTAPTLATNSINGKSAIAFSAGAGTNISAAHNAALNLANYTVYIVMKPTATFAAFSAVMFKVSSGGWSDGWGFGNSGSAGSFDGWSGVYTSFAAAGAIVSGTPYVGRWEFDGSTVSSFLNGVAGTTHAAAAVNNTSAITIGTATGGTLLTAHIAEIVICNAVLSSGDKTSMSNYTTARYALAA